MRILLTADPELPVPPKTYGGIERIVHDLICGLRKRGHEVALAAHPDSSARADRLYPWKGAASRRAYDTIRNTWTLSCAVMDYRPDILHSFSRLKYLLPLQPRR